MIFEQTVKIQISRCIQFEKKLIKQYFCVKQFLTLITKLHHGLVFFANGLGFFLKTSSLVWRLYKELTI